MTKVRQRLSIGAVSALVASVALGSATVPALALDLLPPVAIADALVTAHDRTRTVPPPGVLGNDLDLDGGTKAILVTGASHGSVTLRSDGGYTYVPNAGYVGSDEFRYRASSGLLDSLVTTVSIDVTNARPIARSDAYTVDEGTQLRVAAAGVLGNDSDADGDALAAQLVTSPSNGSLSLASSGGFSYTPQAGFAGSDSFSYRASDAVGTSTATTVSLTVVAAPSPTPTRTPTPRPTMTPTPTPTTAQTLAPTTAPTMTPVVAPTARPTARPALAPTATPSSPPRTTTPVPTRPATAARPAGALGPSGSPAPAQSSRPSGTDRPAAVIAPGAGPTGGAGPGDGVDGGRSREVDVQRLRVEVSDTVLGDFGVLTGVDWAVPALALAVPGLVLVLALLGQAFVGALWVAVSRRRMRGVGVKSAAQL